MHIILTCTLYLFFSFSNASLSLRQEPCIPESANDPQVDDAPAIMDALSKCGDEGTILLPKSNNYNLLSTVHFWECQNCDIQLEGTIVLGGDATTWSNKLEIFNFGTVTGATFHSLTGSGKISGNPETSNDDPDLSIFLITNNSQSLTFSNFRIDAPTGHFFQIDNFSSDISISNLDISSSGFAKNRADAFRITKASQIRIQDITVATAYSCIDVHDGVTDLVARDITCISTWGGVWFDIEGLPDIPQTASDILFTNISIAGPSYATGVRAGNLGSFTASNVTWDGIHVERVGSWVDINACIGGPKQCSTAYGAMGTQFHLEGFAWRNFRGSARRNEEGPECVDTSVTSHDCEFEVVNVEVGKWMSKS